MGRKRESAALSSEIASGCDLWPWKRTNEYGAAAARSVAVATPTRVYFSLVLRSLGSLRIRASTASSKIDVRPRQEVDAGYRHAAKKSAETVLLPMPKAEFL